MKTWTVYQHKNKVNGKSYIGITCKNPPSERWRGSGQGYPMKTQPKFARAIAKYGWENFEHIILYKELTHQEAIQKEIDLIEKLDTINNGYNETHGGEGALGRKCSELAKNKMRETLGDKTRGKYNHFYGKHHTVATKKKISKANKGKPGLIGTKNPMYGKHPIFSQEHKNKIRISHQKNMKPVLLYDCTKHIILKEYESIKEASRREGIRYTTISHECSIRPSSSIHKHIRFIFKEDLKLWHKK